MFDPGDVLYDATLLAVLAAQTARPAGPADQLPQLLLPLGPRIPRDIYRGKRDFHRALESFLLAAGLSHGQINEVGDGLQEPPLQDEKAAARPLAGVKATLRAARRRGPCWACWATTSTRPPRWRAVSIKSVWGASSTR